MDGLRVFGVSDVGLVREKNEDSFWIKDFGDSAVLLVADGMGGAAGGQIASSTVVEVFNRRFGEHAGASGGGSGDLIQESLQEAHDRIRAKGRTERGNLNMGTTCTVAVLSPGGGQPPGGPLQVTSGHIGDSKLFHVRGSLIVQMSEDHTMLQRLLEAGAVRPEEAASFGHKNIIYKSLGGAVAVELDPIQSFTLMPGDALLLCSDGLSNHVGREEMASILLGTTDVERACSYMVQLAKVRGGDDNITVIAAEYGRLPRDPSIRLQRLPKHVRRGPRRRLLLILLLLLLAGLFFSLWQLWRQEKKKAAPRPREAAAKTEVGNMPRIPDDAPKE